MTLYGEVVVGFVWFWRRTLAFPETAVACAPDWAALCPAPAGNRAAGHGQWGCLRAQGRRASVESAAGFAAGAAAGEGVSVPLSRALCPAVSVFPAAALEKEACPDLGSGAGIADGQSPARPRGSTSHVCSCTRPEASCGAAPRAHLGAPNESTLACPIPSAIRWLSAWRGACLQRTGPRLPSRLFASSILALPRPPTRPFLPAGADLLIHPPDQPRRRAGLVLTRVWCEPPAAAMHVPPPRTRSHGHLVTERGPVLHSRSRWEDSVLRVRARASPEEGSPSPRAAVPLGADVGERCVSVN